VEVNVNFIDQNDSLAIADFIWWSLKRELSRDIDKKRKKTLPRRQIIGSR
jgi:hypothetical protein